MRQEHRVIEEEWPLLVPRHEVQRILVQEIGPIFALVEVLPHAIDLQTRIGVARWTARVLPEIMLVEPKLLRQVHLAAELPFARHARGVTRALEQLRKRDGLGVHLPKRS